MTTETSNKMSEHTEEQRLDSEGKGDHSHPDADEGEDLDLGGSNLLNSSLAFLFERRANRRRARSASII